MTTTFEVHVWLCPSETVSVSVQLLPQWAPRVNVGVSVPAEGATFSADAVTFDPATILDGVTSELPDSDIVVFSIVGGPGGAVQYSARVQSAAGGTLDVLVGPDGAVQSVDPGT